MAHGERDPIGVRNLRLQAILPDPRAGAIAPSAICFDQQLRCARIPFAHFTPDPVRQIADGEGRGVSRLADIDRATIGVQIVDAIGNRSAQRIVRKVVRIDPFRRLPPCPSCILEVANQFLFLGVNADHRLALHQIPGALIRDVAKLAVTVGMVAPPACLTLARKR